MRFAEVFLRLGTSLVAWMVLYTYVVWLAALHSLGCGPDGDAMHRLVLALAPVACGCAFLLQVTRPFGDIHKILRWLIAPLVLLLPIAVLAISDVFSRANLNTLAICSNNPAEVWQRLWAPLQATALLIIAYAVVRMIKVTADNKNEGN